MKIVGIVAEYNPFHKGHAYQLQKVREIYGDDTAVVCVMSGDFVQRGEPAVFSKFARAEAAVRCGADLVIELPLHYSVASAERFADGAVSVLGRLGVVDHLVFGSETENCNPLERTAKVLSTKEFDETVKTALETGCSYPAARSMALRQLMDAVDITTTPNNNLGVEYIRAIHRHGFSMKPHSILRVGAMHDADYDGEMKSGSQLRRLLTDGNDIKDFVPEEAYDVYLREMKDGKGPVCLKNLESAMLSRLRMIPFDTYVRLPDAAEGLENKLYNVCRKETNLEKIYDTVKSKRYTHARIRRMVMCAVLGITASDYEKDGLYARVLALNERGGRVLKLSEKLRNIDVISKPSAAREMSDERLALFCKAADAHDLYVLAYDNEMQRRGEEDWVTSPIYIR